MASREEAGSAIRHLVLHTDGGARGNPGPAGLGAVAYDETGYEIDVRACVESLRRCVAPSDAPPPPQSAHRFLGHATNNEAEYAALLYGVQLARSAGAERLTVRMDSELIVRQLQGVYKVKATKLVALYEAALAALTKHFPSHWSVEHVRREYNARADELANQAIDDGLAGRQVAAPLLPAPPQS